MDLAHNVQFPYWKLEVNGAVSNPAGDGAERRRYSVSMMEDSGGRRPPKLFLAEWRKHRGLTQDQLAALMDTSKGNVSKKENNPQAVDTEWLGRFAEAFEIAATDLFKDPVEIGKLDPGILPPNEQEAAFLARLRKLTPDRQAKMLSAFQGTLDVATDPAADPSLKKPEE